MLGNICHTSIRIAADRVAAAHYITLIVSTAPNLSGGLFARPSLKVRLYYNADFSTVNRRVLMFTEVTIFVHKICDFSGAVPAAVIQ